MKLDLPNQTVIKTDTKRTRSELSDKSTFMGYLELMITYYCKSFGITYKQGLNEFMAPFLILKRGSINNSLHEIYQTFSNFCELYSPTLYNDDEFLSIEYSFILTTILLKYHDPELALHLEKNGINPELYSSSWFLTFLA